jgi:hypothetical protein
MAEWFVDILKRCLVDRCAVSPLSLQAQTHALMKLVRIDLKYASVGLYLCGDFSISATRMTHCQLQVGLGTMSATSTCPPENGGLRRVGQFSGLTDREHNICKHKDKAPDMSSATA